MDVEVAEPGPDRINLPLHLSDPLRFCGGSVVDRHERCRGVLRADCRLDLGCGGEQLLLGIQALQLGADLRLDVAVQTCDEVLTDRQLDGPLVPLSRLWLVSQLSQVLLVRLVDGVVHLS